VLPEVGRSLLNQSLSHPFVACSLFVFFAYFFSADAVRVPLSGKAENDTFRGLFRPDDRGEGNLPLIADCGREGGTRRGETSNGTNSVTDPDGPASANVTTGAVLGKKRPPPVTNRSDTLSSLAVCFPRAISLAPASLAKICRRIFTDFVATTA